MTDDEWYRWATSRRWYQRLFDVRLWYRGTDSCLGPIHPDRCESCYGDSLVRGFVFWLRTGCM